MIQRSIGPGVPCQQWPTWDRGTLNSGNNAEKRHQRALKRVFHGAPGGWKRASHSQQVKRRLREAS